MTGYSVSLATLFSMRLLIKKDKKILSLPRKRILRRESIDTSKIISRVTELNLRLRYSARASTSEKKISCLPTQKVEFIKSGWGGAKPSEISSKIWNLNRKIWFVVLIGADDEYGKPIWIYLKNLKNERRFGCENAFHENCEFKIKMKSILAT